MTNWEYKTLHYAYEGKVVYSVRFWADAEGKAYGPRERSRLIAGESWQMHQLEGALKELDGEGWELVSVSTRLSFPFSLGGSAVLRRPSAQPNEPHAPADVE